ncbi:MAG: DUF4177 domain-containing protein [Saprospiraceae bacterium]
MKQFEYKNLKIETEYSLFQGSKIYDEELTQQMNQLGLKGWELVSTIDSNSNGRTDYIVLIFKREIEN